MFKFTIEKTDVHTTKTKNGEMRYQWASLPPTADMPFPQGFKLPLNDGMQPLSPGEYTLAAGSFKINQWHRLELAYSLKPIKLADSSKKAA